MNSREVAHSYVVEREWLLAEQRMYERLAFVVDVHGGELPSPGFPTALTEEEPGEGPNATGGVEVLYSHSHTSLRFLDPFRIVDHDTFAKQVYPGLVLSIWYPANTVGRQLGRRYYNPRDVLISFGGVEIQGFADGDFITVERSPAHAAVFQQLAGRVDRMLSERTQVREWIFDADIGSPYEVREHRREAGMVSIAPGAIAAMDAFDVSDLQGPFPGDEDV